VRLDRLSVTDDEGLYRIVIETPQGGRHKLKYDAATDTLEIGTTLPSGMVFPFDFGFVPRTRGEDGDPLDALLLMDSPGYPGVVVSARLLGVIEADQTDQDGTTVRNDRLVALAKGSTSRGDVQSLKDLDPILIDQVAAFFVQYNDLRGRKFAVRAIRGQRRARTVVDAARVAPRPRSGKAGRRRRS
jgi:inorganic pyrophosphatase